MGHEILINGLPVPVDGQETVLDMKQEGRIPRGHQVMVRTPAGARLLRDQDVLDPDEGDVFTTPPWVYGGCCQFLAQL